eukprot:RCo046237
MSRSFCTVALVLGLVLGLALIPSSEPKKEPVRHAKSQFSHLTELIGGYAKAICEAEGKSRYKWKKNDRYIDRCELFVERVEDRCGDFGNHVFSAMNISSMSEAVADAVRMPLYMKTMREFLQEVAEFVFDNQKVSEHEIDMKLHKHFTDWFLDVITKKHEKEQGLEGINERMRRAMRAQGMKVASLTDAPFADPEGYDEDEDTVVRSSTSEL